MNKLDEIIEILETRGTSGYLAKNQECEGVLPTDPSAVCFCFFGAVAKVYDIKPEKYFDDYDGKIISIHDQVENVELVKKVGQRLDRPTQNLWVVFDHDFRQKENRVLNALKEIRDEEQAD